MPQNSKNEKKMSLAKLSLPLYYDLADLALFTGKLD